MLDVPGVAASSNLLGPHNVLGHVPGTVSIYEACDVLLFGFPLFFVSISFCFILNAFIYILHQICNDLSFWTTLAAFVRRVRWIGRCSEDVGGVDSLYESLGMDAEVRLDVFFVIVGQSLLEVQGCGGDALPVQ